MDSRFRELLARLENLSEQFQELRDGVGRAIRIADEDPEMALTRARKVLEYVIRDVYERRLNEPPGTRPLENLLQRLVKDGHFPDRLDAYANTVRKLGNVGTHSFGEKVTTADVYQSLSQLMPILEWYFEVERPDSSHFVTSASQVRGEQCNVAPLSPLGSGVGGEGQTLARVVPKGLRSFDAQDAGFFLDLLPGPRDEAGLPESIRFWKHRIETRDEPAFVVGVIYGPSGCGKSSLVKAGLLPRLAANTRVVYVEATPDETEARLLRGLRKRCAEVAVAPDLNAAVTALRHGRGDKVLLLLDQFEQWLHAKRTEDNTELVRTLRQCDGERVQALVLVRDDFWLALTRFLGALNIELLQGQNCAVVDLFDLPHARNVLQAFGQAYKTIETPPAREQDLFLDHSVQELAQDGRVISVRLALFADMVKGKPWTPATLKALGGVAGVGVTFLEETFSATIAPAAHRRHQAAARAVLKALLPEQGTEIKGNLKSHEVLRAASGYGQKSREFDELLRILDAELRLITPTEAEEVAGDG